jgi:agmatine deiminase
LQKKNNPKINASSFQLLASSFYRMPAEWELHEATWLTWPTNTVTWPGTKLKEVEGIYLRMMSALLPGEKAHLLVPDVRTGRQVLSRLESKKVHTGNLILHAVKTVDTWIRDYGPIFVKRRWKVEGGRWKNKLAYTKWVFNAWGGKYKDLARDSAVVDRVKYLERFRRIDVPMVLEGGSVDMNGRGTCLTTEQCLLNSNRNPDLTKKEIEARIKKNLGVTKILWLKDGIEGDDTDGHVDDIARFVSSRIILTAVEPDRKDKNHIYLEENLRILKNSTDQDGKKFQLVEFPMPGRVEAKEGHSSSGRLPASYANFYIGNHAVLAPVYSHPNDAKAVRILKKLFPGRKIAAIESTPLVYGLGSIHCVTQQQPL